MWRWRWPYHTHGEKFSPQSFLAAKKINKQTLPQGLNHVHQLQIAWAGALKWRQVIAFSSHKSVVWFLMQQALAPSARLTTVPSAMSTKNPWEGPNRCHNCHQVQKTAPLTVLWVIRKLLSCFSFQLGSSISKSPRGAATIQAFLPFLGLVSGFCGTQYWWIMTCFGQMAVSAVLPCFVAQSACVFSPVKLGVLWCCAPTGNPIWSKILLSDIDISPQQPAILSVLSSNCCNKSCKLSFIRTSVIMGAVASRSAPRLMTIFDPPLFWSLDVMISGH